MNNFESRKLRKFSSRYLETYEPRSPSLYPPRLVIAMQLKGGAEDE